MTSEIALLIANVTSFVALLTTIGVHVWTLKQHSNQEERYIQAILSKNMGEYTYARKVTVNEGEKAVVEEKEPEYINEADISDEQFFDNIRDMNAKYDIS